LVEKIETSGDRLIPASKAFQPIGRQIGSGGRRKRAKGGNGEKKKAKARLSKQGRKSSAALHLQALRNRCKCRKNLGRLDEAPCARHQRCVDDLKDTFFLIAKRRE